MNKKGQALIEFILIMPFFMILIMSLIDVGNIFLKKYELNNSLEVIETLYQNENNEKIAAIAARDNIEVEEKIENDLITITLKKNVKINAPILTNIIGNNYKIETQKSFYKDEKIEEAQNEEPGQ